MCRLRGCEATSLIYIMHKDAVLRSNNAHSFKTHLLMWFMAKIAFDVDNRTRLINIFIEQNAEFLNVTARGKYSYHYGVMVGTQIFPKTRRRVKILVP